MSSPNSVAANNPTSPRLRGTKKVFEKLKNKILGKKYELSLVFCKNALSRKLNRTYRGKDKPTNVLAFPLSKNSGEIFINTSKLEGFSTLHLFIHGALHLKGMKHGSRMSEAEQKLLHVSPNRSRN